MSDDLEEYKAETTYLDGSGGAEELGYTVICNGKQTETVYWHGSCGVISVVCKRVVVFLVERDEVFVEKRMLFVTRRRLSFCKR